MATYEYPLDAAGTKRVKIFQADSGGPVTVLFNGSAIGVISRREEFLTSRSFTLSDGSLVTIQLINNEFQVKYNERSPQYRPAEGNVQRAVGITPGVAAPLKLTQQSTGWIVAGVGALLALLAFFSMPYIAYGYFTATAQQLASAGGQYSSQFTNLQLLWLEPLIAVVLLGIAGVELYKSMGSAHDATGGIAGMIGISGVTLLFVLGKLLFFDAQSTTSTGYFGNTVTSPALASFYGAGFWTFIVGIAIALVGGIIVSRTK